MPLQLPFVTFHLGPHGRLADEPPLINAFPRSYAEAYDDFIVSTNINVAFFMGRAIRGSREVDFQGHALHERAVQSAADLDGGPPILAAALRFETDIGDVDVL